MEAASLVYYKKLRSSVAEQVRPEPKNVLKQLWNMAQSLAFIESPLCTHRTDNRDPVPVLKEA